MTEKRETWNGQISFDVYVAAGLSNSLYTLGTGLRMDLWEQRARRLRAAYPRLLHHYQQQQPQQPHYLTAYTLGTGLRMDLWEQYKELGLTNSGIASIGLSPQDTEYLRIRQLFTDTQLPEFVPGPAVFASHHLGQLNGKLIGVVLTQPVQRGEFVALQQW